MGKHIMLGVAAAAVLVAGCSPGQGGDPAGEPGRGEQQAGANGQTQASPTRSGNAATPSRVGEGGTLVTDATDVTDTLGVFTAGEAAPAYVVDSNRRAVYLLEGDADGSGCGEGCLRDWAPVMPPTGDPTTDGALAPVLVDIIRRPDGTEQMTYNNHPLYHYVGDQTVGDTHGHQLRDDWGSWYLVTPQGTAVGEKEGPMPDEPGGNTEPAR